MWRATTGPLLLRQVRDRLAEQLLRENRLGPALRPVRLARARRPVEDDLPLAVEHRLDVTLAARKPLGGADPADRGRHLVELSVQQPTLHQQPLRRAAVPAEDPRSALLIGARPLAEVQPCDWPLMGERGLRVVLVAAGDRADGHALLALRHDERVTLVHVERQVEDVLCNVVGVRAPKVDGVDAAA